MDKKDCQKEMLDESCFLFLILVLNDEVLHFGCEVAQVDQLCKSDELDQALKSIDAEVLLVSCCSVDDSAVWYYYQQIDDEEAFQVVLNYVLLVVLLGYIGHLVGIQEHNDDIHHKDEVCNDFHYQKEVLKTKSAK